MKRLPATAAASLALVFWFLFAVPGCKNSGNKTATPPSDSSYTLTGHIEGLDSDWVYLVHLQENNHNVDSVRASDSRFSFMGRADTPEACMLVIPAEGANPTRTLFFLENGELTFSGKKDSLPYAVVTGPAPQEEFKRVMQNERAFAVTGNADYHAYQEATTAKDHQKMDSLGQVLGDLNRQFRRSIKDYAVAHPSSYAAAFEVYKNFDYDPDPYQLDSAYKGMNATIRTSFYGQKIKATLDKVMRTATGIPAPDFTLPDIHDKPVSLSSFKGKYTLVDFWASWCGPCRAENPNVVKAYRKYHPKGFAILGVSLDDQKENWAKAIKKDRLAWTHVSDLKGWQSSVAALYGVDGIPMNFLLD